MVDILTGGLTLAAATAAYLISEIFGSHCLLQLQLS